MKTSLLSTILMIAATFTACGDKNKSDNLNSNENTFGGKTFSIVSGALLEGSNDQVLNGSASIVFHEPMKEVNSARNFKLNFSIPVETHGLSLIAFADNKLHNGVQLRFIRTPNNKLSFSVGLDGSTQISKVLNVDTSKEIELSVDVHNNDGDNAHIIIWNGDNEVFNQETTGKGKGSFWGLVLEGPVYSAEVGEPKDHHDH